MWGTAWTPTQELRRGRQFLPEHLSSWRAGWEGASPVDPGLCAHRHSATPRRPAPRYKGLLLCYRLWIESWEELDGKRLLRRALMLLPLPG